jgi:hypothetical protein
MPDRLGAKIIHPCDGRSPAIPAGEVECLRNLFFIEKESARSRLASDSKIIFSPNFSSHARKACECHSQDGQTPRQTDQAFGAITSRCHFEIYN